MMSFMVGGMVPEEYVSLVIEEMGFEEEDARGLKWEKKVSEKVLGRFRVLIIGAGMSGILMAIRRVGQDEAFDLLRRVSQRTNRKLREIADEVVHTGQLPEAPPK